VIVRERRREFFYLFKIARRVVRGLAFIIFGGTLLIAVMLGSARRDTCAIYDKPFDSRQGCPTSLTR
jgi:hypothetical protein